MSESNTKDGREDPAALAISVLIRTWNSEKTLRGVVGRLGPGEGDEIVIVDSGSKDATLEIAREYGAKIVRFEGPFNYSRALNIGFAAAKNPWVLVLSSHCIPARRGYLDYLRREIAELPAAVVVAYGRSVLALEGGLDAPTGGETPRYLDLAGWEREKRSPGGNVNALYRHACWRRRRFDETLVTAEDLDWFIRAMRDGNQAAQLPGAVVLYRNLGKLKHMFTKGFNETRLAAEMLGPRRITWPAFAVGIGSLAKNLLLMRITPGIFVRQCVFQYGTYVAARGAKRFPARAGPSTEGRA